MDEGTVITVSGDSQEEAQAEQATNENDVQIAQIEADAAVAQTAIMAEAQTTQAEIVHTALAGETASHADERISRLEATINELKEIVQEWQKQQEAPSQNPTDILMISAEPTSENPSSSEEKKESEKPSESTESKSEHAKPKASKPGYKPFGLQARRKS